MRRCAQSVGLAVVLLLLSGCSGSPLGIFSFSHKDGGNVAASDSVGMRMGAIVQPAATTASTRDDKAAALAQPN